QITYEHWKADCRRTRSVRSGRGATNEPFVRRLVKPTSCNNDYAALAINNNYTPISRHQCVRTFGIALLVRAFRGAPAILAPLATIAIRARLTLVRAGRYLTGFADFAGHRFAIEREDRKSCQYHCS